MTDQRLGRLPVDDPKEILKGGGGGQLFASRYALAALCLFALVAFVIIQTRMVKHFFAHQNP